MFRVHSARFLLAVVFCLAKTEEQQRSHSHDNANNRRSLDKSESLVYIYQMEL